jgi:hypothetical protein
MYKQVLIQMQRNSKKHYHFKVVSCTMYVGTYMELLIYDQKKALDTLYTRSL